MMIVLSLLMMLSSPLEPITNPGFAPAVPVMVRFPVPEFIKPFKVRPLVPSAVVVAAPVYCRVLQVRLPVGVAAAEYL